MAIIVHPTIKKLTSLLLTKQMGLCTHIKTLLHVKVDGLQLTVQI